MGRKQVVEVQCSRCERVEHQEHTSQADSDELTPVLQVTLFPPTFDGKGAKVVKFEDLCGPCYRTVLALVDSIGKRIEGVSPDRKAKEEEAPAPKPEAKKTAAPHNGGTTASGHAAAVAAPKASAARS